MNHLALSRRSEKLKSVSECRTQLSACSALSKSLCHPAATLWYDGRGDPKAAHAAVVDRYQQFVNVVTRRLTSSGISIETVVKEGHPGKVIIQEAREFHPDLIGLGCHGHGKLRRLVTGDVSQYVIDQAPCSVETVHQKEFNKNE